jgi:hypothetical protein
MLRGHGSLVACTCWKQLSTEELKESSLTIVIVDVPDVSLVARF